VFSFVRDEKPFSQITNVSVIEQIKSSVSHIILNAASKFSGFDNSPSNYKNWFMDYVRMDIGMEVLKPDNIN
jgi:hypothetical protein